MLGIPPAKDTDAEDVVWGLQTAETLWKRGERVDAIVWLRRAAQAADEAKDDDRALELARSAAGLSDWMAAQPLGANNAPPVALPVPTHVPNVPSYAPEEGQMSIEVDMDDADGARGPLPDIAMPAPPQASPPMSAPPQASRPMPPQSRPPSQRTMQMAEPLSADDGAHERPDDMLQTPIVPYAQHDDEERRPGTASVPPADKVHAGMFNPWDDRAPPPPPPVPVAPPPPGTPRLANDDEVTTSLQPQELQQQRAHALAAFLAGGSGQSEAPLPLSPVAWAEEVNAEAVKPAPPRPAPPRPPPLPARAMKPPVPSAPAPPRYPSSSATRVTPPPPSPTQLMLQPPPRVPPARHAEAPPVVEAAPSEHALPTEEQCEEAAAAVEAAAAAEATRGAEASSAAEAESAEAAAAVEPVRLDLDDVEAFADLPDDARRAFALAAKVSALDEGEEVSSFALAYIVSGSVDVAATMVDAAAARLEGGAVLRSRGTTTDGVPMRLIGVSRGVVAIWTDAAVQEAFRTCPWVEEDLRVAADRLQTLVGVTIGPLGERLDASIREQIIGRLTMRTLVAGDVVVPAGEQMPGLLLVGVGELELVEGDKVAGVVGSGEFLFPTEVLGGGNAPNTARAGAGGALILFGDRKIAQELLVTCPPLLEVFAGM